MKGTRGILKGVKFYYFSADSQNLNHRDIPLGVDGKRK